MEAERTRHQTQEGAQNKRQKAKGFYRRLARKDAQIAPGMKGILATCSRGRENACSRELIQLLCEVR
jgi:hypothetical protein